MVEKIPGLTRTSRNQCARCGAVGELKEYHGLDLSQNPEGKELLLKGEFFQWRCPKCGLEADTAWPCWYFDPEAKLGVALVPGIDSSDGGEALRVMNQNLEGLELSGMKRRAAGNFYAVQELVRAQDAGLDDRLLQLVKPLIIGQLQSRGEVVWNGFFQGVSTPDPADEPLHAVLYASIGPDRPPEYGQPVYWYDIHLTNRNVVHTGVNQVIFDMCRQMLDRLGEEPDDGSFRLYDLNWAIGCHNRMQNG